MVAYSFQQRFEPPILAGTKLQTIRAERQRHARPGEALQLYTGMRTKRCRLIGAAICVEVGPITIDLGQHTVMLDDALLIRSSDHLDAFARADGFSHWGDLLTFWRTAHPGRSVFTGVRIRWGALNIPAAVAA